MDRRTRHRRRTGALWLLLLAVVSVFAPVWADTYVCPMAEEALAKANSCCAKAEAMHSHASPGTVQFEPPCDCPKLSWSANPADQVRELRTGVGAATELAMEIPRFALPVATQSAPIRFSGRDAKPRSTPSLWRLNQAILC